MRRFAHSFSRALLLALTIGFLGTLALTVLPVFVQAQDAPAADCNAGPHVACPAPGDPAAPYIGSVTAVPDGVIILLTNDGLDKARECDGAAEIAALAKTLYDAIPESEKAAYQLDWTSQRLYDEIYGHAFFNRLSSGIAGMGDIYERSNPINVVFADYGAPGDMTTEARAEQATFATLGTIHRAGC
jgi:hypothetical protein